MRIEELETELQAAKAQAAEAIKFLAWKRAYERHVEERAKRLAVSDVPMFDAKK